jgi:hypothetical protein
MNPTSAAERPIGPSARCRCGVGRTCDPDTSQSWSATFNFTDVGGTGDKNAFTVSGETFPSSGDCGP